MKFTNKCSVCRLLMLFGFVPLILLSNQFTNVISAHEEQIRPDNEREGNLLTSPGEKGAKKKAMTDTDKLTGEDGKLLLLVARNAIKLALFGGEDPKNEEVRLPEKFSKERGTFVTLKIGGRLRGCIGHLIPRESLMEGVRVNAVNAAFRDPRFQRLTGDEFNKIKIEISILTEPKPLSYANAEDLLNKLRPGIDGVIIKKGFRQSTFLPQVWEQLPDKKEFLSHLCAKAGLDGDEWRKGDLSVSTYQAQAFEE